MPDRLSAHVCELPRSTVLAAIASGIVGISLPGIARAQNAPLRIAGVFADIYAEPLYAKDAGTFAKGGLDVVATNLNNAAGVVAAIGGGSLEMGTGDLISGVNAVNAGVPIVLIAGGATYNERTDKGIGILAVAADSPIVTAKDLVGKSIAVPTLVGLTTACLRSWLPAHGVPESSVHLLELSPSAAVPALQRGTIAAALLSEPFITLGKGLVRSVGSPFDAAAEFAANKTFCVSVWYASKSWFESDPARSRRVVQAIYDTAAWANSHRDETFAILVRDGKLDADKARGMTRVTYATSLTPELVQPTLEVAAQNKMFSKPVDARALITKP